MDLESLRRVRELFEAAVEKPAGERSAFLEAMAGSDPSLVDEVRSLLANDEAAKGFLSRPAALPESLGAPPQGRLAPSLVGRQIGPYRLLDEMGRGGMGAVYRAVRSDDTFQKTVALKLVRGGASSDLMEQRFRRERVILGRLQHPNIATVFDGGTTEDGQPYVVMEYVEGEPIDRYCAERSLSTSQRLAVFRQVCGAVHYAHRNLVVHRDIKPGNILVTEDGTPKLLDFGIAKLLAAGVDPDQAPTATLLPMMTPEYASPEQVKGETVTISSDVYSLGVVLYELLTGRRPYEVRAESLEEIVRAVCGTEPPAPSAAVRTGSPDTTRPRVVASELRGDLDTIVLKALRKEPGRRYLSALELAEDIQRCLEGLPVTARSDTVRYRAGKFVKRHRVAVAAVVLVGLSLVGGIGMTARQARIAEAQRLRAERRFEDVRKLANSFMFDIHDEIRDLPGSNRARQRLAATAQEYLDSLAQESQGDMGLQRELAAAYERLGDVQGGAMSGNLGDTKGALDSYRKALAIGEAIAEKNRKDPEAGRALTRVQLRVGDVLRSLSRLPEAEKSYRDVTRSLEVLASSDARDDLRGDLAAAYQKLSEVLVLLGRDDAGPALQKAIGHGEAFCRDHPDDGRAQLTLASAYYVDSESLRSKERHAGALERVRQARAIQEALLERDPQNQLHVRALLFSLNREALNLEALKQQSDALRVYGHAVDLAEAMFAHDPKDRWAQASLMVAHSSLGAALVTADKRGLAVPKLRRGRLLAARILAEDPAYGFARNELAVIDSNLGDALFAEGTTAARREACQAFERSLETWRQMQAEGPLPADSIEAVPRMEARIAQCRDTIYK